MLAALNGVSVEGHQVDHGIDIGLRLEIEPCVSGDIGMARFPGAELFLGDWVRR
jgi:hypothetical protein